MKLSFSIWMLLFSISIVGMAPLSGNSQATIQKKETTIQIFPEEDRYETKVVVSGIVHANQSAKFQISHKEQEVLSLLLVQYRSTKGKWIRLKNKEISEANRKGNAFYEGIREYTFELPSSNQPYDFRYSYFLTSHPLILLTGAPLAEQELVDSIIYEVNYPKGYQIHQQISGNSNPPNWYTLSNQNLESGLNQFRMVSTPPKQPESNKYNIPFLNLFFTPVNKEPFQFLYEQYTNLIDPSLVVDKMMMDEINLLFTNEPGNTNRIDKLFWHLQEQFQYLDMENGLNALIPNPVNLVWKNKMGDCKDLSSLLVAVAKNWGYESYLVLTSTHGYPFQLDFPSPASANHAICVIKNGADWFYYDLAYRGSLPGYPSFFIEGQPAMLLGKERAELFKIPRVDPEKNQATFSITLEEKENLFGGKFEAEYQFQSTSFMLTLQHLNFKNQMLKQLNFGNSIVPEIERFEHLDTTWTMTGKLVSRDLLTKLGEQYYLQFAKLPFPHLFTKKLKLDSEKYLGFGHKKSYEIILNLENGIQEINAQKYQFSENGFTFDFGVERVGSSSISIQYSYFIEPYLVSENQVAVYTKWSKYIEDVFQQVLVVSSK